MINIPNWNQHKSLLIKSISENILGFGMLPLSKL